MRRGLAACALAALALLAAPRAALAHGSHAGVIRGSVTFQMHCAGCHGLKGHGDGPRAADGLARPSDLTRIAERHGGRFERGDVAGWIAGPTRVDAHGDADVQAWAAQGLRAGPAGPAEGEGGAGVSPRMKELLDYLQHMQTDR